MLDAQHAADLRGPSGRRGLSVDGRRKLALIVEISDRTIDHGSLGQGIATTFLPPPRTDSPSGWFGFTAIRSSTGRKEDLGNNRKALPHLERYFAADTGVQGSGARALCRAG